MSLGYEFNLRATAFLAGPSALHRNIAWAGLLTSKSLKDRPEVTFRGVGVKKV